MHLFQTIKHQIIYRWRRLLAIALIVGPGLVTAFADNDAAGISTYTAAAAEYGYTILLIIIPLSVLLGVTQEIGGRIAIIAEKGLGDLIRETYGIRTAVIMFALVFIVNMVVVIMDISGVKAALTLFGLQTNIFLPIILLLLFLVVVLMSYRAIERFFLFIIGFYIMFIISAFLAKPNWNLAVTSLLVPSGAISPAFLYTAIAVIGTTITAWGQFFISSYVKDKRLTTDHLKYNRWEVYLASVLTHMLIFFLMVAVIATLFTNRISVTDAAQAAQAITPFAGDLAGILFGIGLLAGGILGCVIVPLATAYAFSEFFGYSGSLDEDFQQSKPLYVIFLVQLIIGMGVVLLPQVSLFTITIVGNFINGVILPVIFYFLYQFANNERIMGTHKNNTVQNFLLVGAGVSITIASGIGLIGQILSL